MVCAHELASPDFLTFIDEIVEDFHDVGIPVKKVYRRKFDWLQLKRPISKSARQWFPKVWYAYH